MVVQIIETTSLGYTEHRKGLETDASGPVHVFGSVFKIRVILEIGNPFVNKKRWALVKNRTGDPQRPFLIR
jgi:hypothetical protein